MKAIALWTLAIALGTSIAYVDSRPTWDDAGVTAMALFLIAAAFGFAGPRRPWIWATALGVWIPLLGVLGSGNYGSLLALLVAFAGAYGGMLLRKATLRISA